MRFVSKVTYGITAILLIISIGGCQTTSTMSNNAPSDQNSAVSAPDNISDIETQRLHKIIKDYILANPGIINQAMQITRLRQQSRSQKSVADLLKGRNKNLYNDAVTLDNGVEDADVTIVEFFDYRCGFCKKANPVIKTILASDPKIKIIYKEYPILGPVSGIAARAAIAARKQGKYEELHNKIFGTPGRLTEKRLMQDAASIGLDITQLKTDMLDTEIEDMIIRNKVLAKGLRITGTPTFIIGNQIIQGFINLDKMKQAVAIAREVGKNVAEKN